MSKHDVAFEKIAQDAIEAAEAVDCSGEDFVKGLKIICGELGARLEAAKDEFGDDEED